MAKAKYREYAERMLKVHKKEFDEFRKIHDEYSLNEEKLQERFNKEGSKIMLLVKQWESKLCMQSEKGGYGSFTTRLAEKFQEEVKKHFPNIDKVGIIVEEEPVFSLKRIKLG